MNNEYFRRILNGQGGRAIDLGASGPEWSDIVAATGNDWFRRYLAIGARIGEGPESTHCGH